MSTQTYMQSMYALGTLVEIRLVSSSLVLAEAWFAVLWKEIVEFEARFSRFIPTSELSQFNAHAGEKIPVSEICQDIFEKTKQFGKITDGIFNPFILPELQRKGYLQSMTHDTVLEEVTDFRDRAVMNYTALEIGDDWARIPKESALDLGGIGKGYLADHLAGMLKDIFDGYCLSLGGDCVVQGKDANNEKWSIDIQMSENPLLEKACYVSEKQTFGIATSGLVREKRDKKQEHQIAPLALTKTVGQNTLCTVVSNDATTADVLASSILVGGEKFAQKLFEKGLVSGVFLQDNTRKAPIILGEGFVIQT